MVIQVENTAIRTGISKSAMRLERDCVIGDKILDYGAGKLRNSLYLVSKGHHVSILDTPLQIQRQHQQELESIKSIFTAESYLPQAYFDSVLCSFVLNVIPEQRKRNEILEKIHNSLKPGGRLYLEVRKKNGILKTKYKEPYTDGFVIGRYQVKTFQRPFEKEEVKRLVENHLFLIRDAYSLSDSVLVVAEKRGDRE
ncbi:methyltransferase domain-containing protein (plasmid) [Aneurinibacillus sp. Ricciae_BoGa-3]|uniref:class I SAM-dependent methyltransferase n=1 Tax=Aneurinibacillus sp. Ricciae_BoGa-3 TaxID=3022697 RepID=UPI0023409BC4|nr:methyltransferase domain-containing protein [Aneurinibacillus sp. Ricciae_BoGa-3]WCK57069.1 methyltransferase domain-containing protein [Aneurinibacillus sp. Ricciae_BoGa-3]